ncbi:NUDIX domain-containing protein [Rufibacter roseus]|uniref:GDP-mannose pyrophosphatase n=1 Tax=Rufibacter roseus TaxID=1567108 RepID=A0ABW2DLR8_9BACT|nr:NUDIX hydrolase [Rufibacter roseus]
MEITNKETVYQGHYRLQVYTVKSGQEEFKREVFQTGKAAAAIVYDTNKQKFIFAKQYRPAVEQEVLEAVAGMLDADDEKPEEAIAREVEEEVGYEVDKLEYISEFYPSPGSCQEKIFLFYAEVSHKSGEGGGKDDENEDIKSVEMTAEELVSYNFVDAKTLIGVQWTKTNVLPKLT